jgi:hypothetical protein
VFVVTFVVGLALVGELAGSVGETDETFVELFSSDSRRLGEIVGSFLLVVAGLAFLYFTRLLVVAARRSDQEAAWEFVGGTGMLAAGGLIVAAVAFLTVPLSINFGNLYGDPAFGEGQAVIPQFGFAALTVGAMWPAAVMITTVGLLGSLPVWLSRVSYVIAVALVVTCFMVSTLFVLLPVWVVLTALALRRGLDRSDVPAEREGARLAAACFAGPG